MLLSALLLVLLLAAGRCTAAAALLRRSGSWADGRSGMEPGGRYPKTRPEGAGLNGPLLHGPEGHARDSRHKERFIKHLTGPLSFSPKCRKHFHRLYHNTRDCTTPAYYKRCARLLTRLASSPRCTER
ncbi:ALK and LTK ligand 2-like [Sander lucioperca]|nr:ALK and LTK ligand 2-like [Sander lucioperca]